MSIGGGLVVKGSFACAIKCNLFCAHWCNFKYNLWFQSSTPRRYNQARSPHPLVIAVRPPLTFATTVRLPQQTFDPPPQSSDNDHTTLSHNQINIYILLEKYEHLQQYYYQTISPSYRLKSSPANKSSLKILDVPVQPSAKFKKNCWWCSHLLFWIFDVHFKAFGILMAWTVLMILLFDNNPKENKSKIWWGDIFQFCFFDLTTYLDSSSQVLKSQRFGLKFRIGPAGETWFNDFISIITLTFFPSDLSKTDEADFLQHCSGEVRTARFCLGLSCFRLCDAAGLWIER